jgi:hypothetical protein
VVITTQPSRYWLYRTQLQPLAQARLIRHGARFGAPIRYYGPPELAHYDIETHRRKK